MFRGIASGPFCKPCKPGRKNTGENATFWIQTHQVRAPETNRNPSNPTPPTMMLDILW